jgi:hypothetical protein
MTNMNYREYTALMSAVDKIMEDRTVSISENPNWGADLKTFGVNWSACGTQSIEETKKFTEQINKACKIAEKLNAMQITVNYENAEEPDREAYMALISKYIEELQD